MEKDIESYFKKFYNMKPYLFIDKKEWKHIMDTYEKDDVIEELSKALHTYPCPVPEISEKDIACSWGFLIRTGNFLHFNCFSFSLWRRNYRHG